MKVTGLVPHTYVETEPYMGCGTCRVGPGAFHHNEHEVKRYEAQLRLAEDSGLTWGSPWHKPKEAQDEARPDRDLVSSKP